MNNTTNIAKTIILLKRYPINAYNIGVKNTTATYSNGSPISINIIHNKNFKKSSIQIIFIWLLYLVYMQFYNLHQVSTHSLVLYYYKFEVYVLQCVRARIMHI